MASDEPPDDAAVFDFLDEFLRDLEHGKRQPLTHYLARYPGHEEAVAGEYFAELNRAGLAGVHKTNGAAASSDGDPTSDPQRVGPYRLLRELGRGGQGAVWLAEDTRIARHVALKLLPAEFAALSTERRRRLQREAEVIARLDHPCLCAVLDARIDGERPYIAMRYVEGGTLGECIVRARDVRKAEREGAPAAARAPGPIRMFPRTALEQAGVLMYFERAARALHAAHEVGVMHRDVKPQNLMVTRSGDPVVLDFGQARDATSDSFELTRSGDVLGTPAYMSPEQILGKREGVDRRTDVWSLGASLYEALTLTRAFEAESVPALFMAIRGAVLPDPRSINPALPTDLSLVVATALEKDPELRYRTALDFAEDLRRVREYEPVRARPPSAWRVFRSWFQRHPAIAYSTLGSLVALSIGLASSLYQLSETNKALGEALGRHLGHRADELLDEDPAAALALGIEAVERAPAYETRASLFRALQACHLRSLIDGSPARRALDLSLAPDSRKIAVALDDGGTAEPHVCVRICSLETGETLVPIHGKRSDVRAVKFAPDGSALAFVTAANEARIVNARDGAELASFALLPGEARSIEFISGGKEVIALSDGGAIIAGAADGKERWRWMRPEAQPNFEAKLSIDASGARGLLWYSRSSSAKDPPPESSRAWLIDFVTGSVVREIQARGGFVCSEFRRDGARIATGSDDGTLRLWRGSDGELEREFDKLVVGKSARCVRFDPDGQRLVTILEDSKVLESRAWLIYLATGATVPIGSPDVRVVDAAFDQDGNRLATVGSDMLVCLWSGSDNHLQDSFRGLFAPRKVVWASDGRRLATLANGPIVSVWYAGARPDVYPLRAGSGRVCTAHFAPDGEHVVVASDDGVARVWATPSSGPVLDYHGEVEGGKLVASLRHHGTSRLEAVWSPDGTRIATAGEDGSARLWSASDGSERFLLVQGLEELPSLAFSPDGVHVAVRTKAGVLLCDATAVSAPRSLASTSDATCFVWLSAPARVVTGHADGTIQLFDAASGKLLQKRKCAGKEESDVVGVTSIGVNRDGSQIAVACTDGAARFFVPESSDKELGLWLIQSQSIAFNSDGSRLLVIGRGGKGALRLHDLLVSPPRELTFGKSALHDERGEIGQSFMHKGEITGGAFSADGRWVITTAKEGGAYVRSAEDGDPFAHFAGPGGGCFAGEISTGQGPARALVAFHDGSVWIWPLDPLPAARARQPHLPMELRGMLDNRERQLAGLLKYKPLHGPGR